MNKNINNTQTARKALLAYMEWWSDKVYCAGWLYYLPDDMANKELNSDVDVFQWLVEEAGGWYIHDEQFIPGTFQDLLENGSGEKSNTE